MIRTMLVLMLGLTVVSCAFDNPKGEGPILISKRVERAFEAYKEKSNPMHFAVSDNGRQYGYSYCGDTKCRKGGQSIALNSCRQRAGTIPCRIFASGENIVWDGPVNYEY